MSMPSRRPQSGPDGPPGPLPSGLILNGPPSGLGGPSLGTRPPGPMPGGFNGPPGSHSQGPPERPQGHGLPTSGPMGGPLHVPTPKDYPQMPCSSMGPKNFDRPNNFGRVTIILDRSTLFMVGSKSFWAGPDYKD